MEYKIRTENTKKILAESLKRLMKVKTFSKITVTDIISDCGVNRNTFYYHFQDIYDLLKWMFEKEAIEVVKNFDLLSNYEDAIIFVLDYVSKNDHIINCAYDSIGREGMKRFFYNDFIDIITSLVDTAEKEQGVCLEKGYKRFICDFYTEALSGMLIDIVQDKNQLSRDKYINYLTSFFKDTLKGVFYQLNEESTG